MFSTSIAPMFRTPARNPQKSVIAPKTRLGALKRNFTPISSTQSRILALHLVGVGREGAAATTEESERVRPYQSLGRLALRNTLSRSLSK